MVEALANYRQTFYQYIAIYGTVAGANMTDANYKPNPITYMWLCSNLSYNVAVIYTMVAYRDSEISWQSACIQGLCMQGWVKYLVLMVHSKSINAKVRFLQVLFESNRNVSTKNYESLRKWSQRSLWFVKYGILPVGISSTCFMIYPLLMYLMTGETKTLMVPMLFPGIDESSVFGYVFLCVYHTLALILCVFGQCNVDFLMVLLVMHLWPISDIYANMFDEMNEALETPTVRGTNEMRTFLRNLVVMHTEVCEYLKDISEVYYYMVLMEVVSCAESMCALMYCMITMNWLPLYFLMMLMFTKLLAYCAVGTMAELATDRVYHTMIVSKWYLLPVREQHYIRLMIAMAQNPTILMAGTMPLNLDTFVRVMKTVYSVGMLLLGATDA